MVPDSPPVPHFGKLNNLQAVPEDSLTQAAWLHVDVVLGGGHEHLPAVILIGYNRIQIRYTRSVDDSMTPF